MITTLNKIRSHSPCDSGWVKLLRHLGKTKADDEPLSIVTVLDSNGLDDALWCLRAVEGHDREIRLFAVWCARQVQHVMTDPRSVKALDVAERFANGDATQKELAASWAASWGAARAAAWDAARAASWAAAWAAARDAALGAARATAAPFVWASVWASAAEYAAQAMRDAQAQELRRICAEIEAKEKQMARKYVWIAYTVSEDVRTGYVQAHGKMRADVDNIAGMEFEGPVPADMYPIGKAFPLIEDKPA